MIYLDHTATSRLYPEVASYIASHIELDFANPASSHSLGLQQDRLLKDARQSMAEDLGCKPQELVVTSGGTESINTAIFGTAKKMRHGGRRIVTTAGEHDAVLTSVRQLKQDGYDIAEAPLTADGKLDLKAFEALLTPDTILISIIGVNNETGSVNDLAAVSRLRQLCCPDALIHVDYVQAWTKIPLNLRKSGANFASFSAHKIHGPKGIGLLYVKEGTAFQPLIYGGGQQGGRRSGTENVLMTSAMAMASRLGSQNLAERSEKTALLNRHFRHLLSDLPVIYNSPDDAVPHILNMSFPGVRGETMLHILASRGIYVSTTSACASSAKAKSHVLKAMGLPEKQLDSTLRISFDADNTEEEIEAAAAAVRDAYRQLAVIGGKR